MLIKHSINWNTRNLYSELYSDLEQRLDSNCATGTEGEWRPSPLSSFFFFFFFFQYCVNVVTRSHLLTRASPTDKTYYSLVWTPGFIKKYVGLSLFMNVSNLFSHQEIQAFVVCVMAATKPQLLESPTTRKP